MQNTVEFSDFKKMLFIYNPLSGKAQVHSKLAEILDIFTKAGYLVTCYPTQNAGDCYKMIAELASKYDIIVTSGGDGTLSESIKGLMYLEDKRLLGYIPAGTTNDFAYTLGIPKGLTEAAKTVVEGIPFEYDIGQFNNEYYTYIAAFGAFTNVSYETPQRSKNIFGHMAYIMEGIKQITALESYVMTVEHDGESITDEFILGMVTNTVSIGGFRQLTDMGVILDDGLFEVILIKVPQSMIELQNTITCAMKQDLNPKYFYSFKSRKVTFKCDNEVSWTLDGENGGKHKEVIIRNKMRAVSIIVSHPYEETKDEPKVIN